MHRIGDVHSHAPVQVVTDLHHRWRLRRQPISEHVEFVIGVTTSGEPPDHRLRRQIDSARSDVDLGELRGHGLESRQWLPELLPVGHVVGGQTKRSGHQPVGIRTQHRQSQLVDPVRRSAHQHIGIGNGHITQRHRVLIRAVRRRRAGQLHTLGLRRHHHDGTVGGDDQPLRMPGISDTDLGARQPATRKTGGRPVGQRGARLVECRGQHRPLGDPGQVTVLLLSGGQIKQRHRTQAQRCQRRCHGTVPAGFGQDGPHLEQPHPVAAEPFRHRQCRHSAVDQRSPGGIPLQHRRDHIGNRLLFRGEIEVHYRATELETPPATALGALAATGHLPA
uniref:Uncharacterized protein n=1 Tax=Mycobacterium kansasii TaxID=1768 RepID=A0A653F4S2_MYCKA|nr:hypothetical protein BIN_B_04192 [Mycobacterium kansasii]